MKIINEKIQHYAELFSSEEPEILVELNRETYVKHLFPRMLSGHHQGRFLSMMSKMLNPKRILEIGTFTGYSALCLAEGLAEDGLLHTIEINNENEDIIRKYIEKTGNTNKIMLHFGTALNIIPGIDEIFDMAFLDADKESYIEYFNLVIDKIRPGGIILAENALWDGKVLDQRSTDKESVGIRTFNYYIKNDTRIDHVLLTIRDGIMIIRKK